MTGDTTDRNDLLGAEPDSVMAEMGLVPDASVRPSALAARRRGALDRFWNHRVSGPVLFLVVAVSYLALAQFAIVLNDPVNLGGGFWPAAGLSLAVLMLVRPGRWGWVLAGVAVAELGGDLARGYPLEAALFRTAGSCIEPLVGAVLLRRWGNRSGSLVPLRQLSRFLVAAVVVGPMVGASIGTIGTIITIDGMGVWQVWPKYFVGDALGVLVAAPMLLCWSERRTARSLGETVTLAVALVAVAFVAFRTWGHVWDSTLPYLVIPLLIWAALRYGVRGAALGVFATTSIAIWFTATGEGPFAVVDAATGDAAIHLQIFIVITAVSTLVAAALVEDLVDRTEAEVTLARQASTDSLTGLPNRALLTSALNERVLSPSGRGRHRGMRLRRRPLQGDQRRPRPPRRRRGSRRGGPSDARLRPAERSRGASGR